MSHLQDVSSAAMPARSVPASKVRIPDTMQLAAHIMTLVREHNPFAVFIDAAGIGWVVYDRLNLLECSGLVAEDFGSKTNRTDGADANAKYANNRAEMWGFMRDWLRFGALPDDGELKADLVEVRSGEGRATPQSDTLTVAGRRYALKSLR